MTVGTDQLHETERPDPVDPSDTPGGWHGEFITATDEADGTARVKLPGYALDADFEVQGITPHGATWPAVQDTCVCLFDDEQFCWVVAWRPA